MTDEETLLGIDAASAWFAFRSEDTLKSAGISTHQALQINRVASFVRGKIGGRYPSGKVCRGFACLAWDSHSHFLFVEILRDGTILWELSDERIFKGTSIQGDGWDKAFEAAVDRFSDSVKRTKS